MQEKLFKIARVGLHHFEEPCISGESGSGTIFFSGCTLNCKFCQNYSISALNEGILVDKETLKKCMLYLQDLGANNINLVTPALYVNLLKNVLYETQSTLKIPIVWNSSGFESEKSLEGLEGLVDIFLPDYKYSDDNLAWEYSNAKGYSEIAFKAISKMRKMCPVDEFDDNGLMKKGVIVRHLVLPEHVDNSLGVLDKIAEIDKDMYVSVMSQYFPTEQVKDHPVLGKRITEEEYDEVINHFFEVGLHNGFSQEPSSAIEEYVPDFDLEALKAILINF